MMQGHELPLVSVVIPTYNSARYLPATLESVLGQTYPRTEVIVIDDGSGDETPALMADYNDRLIYIRQENFGGPSGPRNVGVARASGDFVALFDSDDLMRPEKLTEQMNIFLADPSVDLVFSDFTVIDDEGETVVDRFLSQYNAFRDSLRPSPLGAWRLLAGTGLYHALVKGNFIGTSGVVVRKEALREAGGFDQSLMNADDIDMWLRLARAGKTFALLEKPLHDYRRRPGSVTKRGSRRYPNMLRVLDAQVPHVQDPAVAAHLARRIRQVTLGYAYALRCEGDHPAACREYRRSLAQRPTPAAVRGLLASVVLSLLGRRSR